MKRKGFTLIEMLIVIAVIGVLAVAVLSAINPVEQMRKARDTRRRSNAAELLNALERYYATYETYPADFTGGTDDKCTDAYAGGEITQADLGDLVASSNELKAEFSNRITDAENYLYAGVDPTSELVTVCYEVESAANAERYSGAPNWCSISADLPNVVCLPE